MTFGSYTDSAEGRGVGRATASLVHHPFQITGVYRSIGQIKDHSNDLEEVPCCDARAVCHTSTAEGGEHGEREERERERDIERERERDRESKGERDTERDTERREREREQEH